MTRTEAEFPHAPDLSVVVLCYRSAEELIPTVRELHALLSLLAASWEIILVANFIPGSNDRTPEIANGLALDLPRVRCISQEKSGWMGWDMRSGLDMARGRYIAVIDGDGQFPMEAIIRGYMKIRTAQAGLVTTYRAARGDGLFRSLISASYNRLSRLLFPNLCIRDINSKPKILTRELLDSLHLTDDGWFIDAEIVLKAHLLGSRIEEFPIYFYKLRGRHSFVHFVAILEFLKKLIAFRRDAKNITAMLTKPPDRRS